VSLVIFLAFGSEEAIEEGGDDSFLDGEFGFEAKNQSNN